MSRSLTDEEIFAQLDIALAIPIGSEDELQQSDSDNEDISIENNPKVMTNIQIAFIPDQSDVFKPVSTNQDTDVQEESGTVHQLGLGLDQQTPLTRSEPKPSTSHETNVGLSDNLRETRGVKRKLPTTIAETLTPHTPILQCPGTVKPRNVVWKQFNLTRNKDDFIFTGSTALPNEIVSLDSPLQYFNFFFTDNLIEKICHETHKYSVQLDPNKPFFITKTELRKFLGICILMSLVHVPNSRNYWNEILGNRTIIDTMPVKHFEMIRKYLHFNDNELAVPKDDIRHDRLHKIRPILDSFNERCAQVPLEESLSVDEQMCATKVKHFLKQYMPNKPHKWGYKLFILAGVSGFSYHAEIYSGLENDHLLRGQLGEKDLGPSANIVMRLARNIPENCHYKLYFDNYYTTLPLLVELEKKGIHCLGTFRRNRFPGVKLLSEKEANKKPRGYSEECNATVEGVNISAIGWKDNRIVSLASTFVGKTPETSVKRFDRKEHKNIQVDCPDIVTVYNRHMGGVDLLDSLIGRYRNKMKSKKWYFRLFYHLLDLTIVNSWLLYRRANQQKGNTKTLGLAEFRRDIGVTLCKYGHIITPTRGRPRNEVEELINVKKKKGPTAPAPPKDVRQDQTSHWPQFCEVRQRCKLPGCSAKTYSKCVKCGVYLCLHNKKNCFVEYHNN